MAKTDFDDIEPFRQDEYFAKALDLHRDTPPSSPTIRQRLDVASAEWDQAVLKANTKLLKEDVQFVPCPEGFVLLNFDVSPMDNSDSRKEGVSRTYKDFDGYAPIFACLGQNEGYMVNLEFREGKTHCQNGTLEFVGKTIRVARIVSSAGHRRAVPQRVQERHGSGTAAFGLFRYQHQDHVFRDVCLQYFALDRAEQSGIRGLYREDEGYIPPPAEECDSRFHLPRLPLCGEQGEPVLAVFRALLSLLRGVSRALLPLGGLSALFVLYKSRNITMIRISRVPKWKILRFPG